MNLVNKQVTHRMFGSGSVIEYNDSYVSIEFASGNKTFVFPDAFATYLTLKDQGAAKLVNTKIKEQEKKRRKMELRLKEERALERKRQLLLRQERRIRNRKIHPKSQSVFWCEDEEQDKVFTDWKVFTDVIKSGKRKGEIRRLARIKQNSGCLITKRDPGISERDRLITGVFMVNPVYRGRIHEDGYILAHPDYRIRLSEDESEKMLFWNYYVNERAPHRTVWNSGRQRYFDNIWMAQILRDILSLKKKGSKEREYSKGFLEYFCKANQIEQENLPSANGALMRN